MSNDVCVHGNPMISACSECDVENLNLVVASLEAENARLRANVERYEAMKRDVTDGELIVCYTGDDGGDIGGPECIDDWLDSSIDAAKGETP